MHNPGTLEGIEAEINFVRYCNANKNLDNPIWKLLHDTLKLNSDLNNYHIIRVTHHVYSKLSNELVLPKADAYLINAIIPQSYIINNNYYLHEDNIDNFNIHPHPYSGISIKRPDSKKFQIIKMTPNTFRKLIGNYVLGAAASLYCKNSSELYKNLDILNGWNSSYNDIKSYFTSLNNINLIDSNTLSDIDKLKLLKQIKTRANQEIKQIILSNSTISNIVFKGTDIYDEPYSAYFLYKDNNFILNESYNFTVTTGSGRSKGNYTIVLKP